MGVVGMVAWRSEEWWRTTVAEHESKAGKRKTV